MLAIRCIVILYLQYQFLVSCSFSCPEASLFLPYLLFYYLSAKYEVCVFFIFFSDQLKKHEKSIMLTHEPLYNDMVTDIAL